MKTHADKGILNIDYNFLNLPRKLTFNQSYIYRNISSGTSETRNVTTQYIYRADGVKLSKTYTFGVSKNQSERNTVTDYLDGFQYEGTGVSTSLITKVLKFVPTSEGYFNFENNTYIYHYTDHLGNVRVSYFKNANGSAEVLEESNYYPFGLKHYGYDSGNGNPSYKYQYNGKELQEETGWNDYGWRQYMPEIGRWNGMDQLSESYISTSPYAYVANNPILSFDVDGRWFDGEGNIVDTSGQTNYLLGSNYQPAFYNYKTDYLGQNPGDGGGGNGGSEVTLGQLIDAYNSNNGPEPSIWQSVKNFFSNLFGQKGAGVTTVLPGAVVTRAVTVGDLISEGVETSLSFEEVMTAVGSLRGGIWAVPLLFNGDSAHAPAYDVPITTTDEPEQPGNLYLYRNMRSIGGMPQLGNSLNTLGVRNTDFSSFIFGQLKSDLDYVYGSSGEGMSVTPGYGNSIPSTPFGNPGKTILFRIKATDVFRSGLGINIDAINHANITPIGRTTLQQFRLQVQATAPLWKPIN